MVPAVHVPVTGTASAVNPLCNYQLSKSIVHEIRFGDNINNLPYSDRYFRTDWQFEMFKRGNPMDMILV